MPLYEYECANCGKQCEMFERMAVNGCKPEPPKCPFCGKNMLVKKPSVANFKIMGYNSGNGYNKKEK